MTVKGELMVILMKFISIIFLSILFYTDTTFPRDNTFQQCVKFLEAGKLQEVLELSKKLSGDEYYHILSLYYMYKGNYNASVEEIKKTDLKESKANLFLYLKNLIKKTEKFEEFETENFRIRLSKEDSILKKYLIDNLQKIFTKVGAIFNHFPEEKILVEIYPDKESFAFASTLGDEIVEKSGVVGICKFNRIMIVSPKALPQGYRWLNTISHEYTHFLVNRISEYGCPLWLHEGIAKYYETIWKYETPLGETPGNINLLIDAIKNNKIISFEKMSPSLVYLKNQDEITLAFVEVSNAIKFIIENYSHEKLLELLRNFSKFKFNEETSFKKTLGISYKKFKNKWLNYVRSLKLEKTEGALPDKIIWKKFDEVNIFVGISARDYVRLGDKFRINGKPEIAYLEYKKALEIEPFNPVILLKISKTLMELGKIDEAEKYIKICVEKNLNYVSGWELLGEIYIIQKKYKEAYSALTEATEINPFNSFTQLNLNKIYRYLENSNLTY